VQIKKSSNEIQILKAEDKRIGWKEQDEQLNDGLYEIMKEYFKSEIWEKQFTLSFLEPAVGKCDKET